MMYTAYTDMGMFNRREMPFLRTVKHVVTYCEMHNVKYDFIAPVQNYGELLKRNDGIYIADRVAFGN